MMRQSLLALVLAGVAGLCAASPARAQPEKPVTVVLVHGAFAESSSWNGVITDLSGQGYRVIAAANPLRGVQNDAAFVSTLLKSIPGPVVLVGHSYGGAVITAAATGNANVKALVYVDAVAPDTGESVADLAGRYPGGTLGQALAPPVALPDGGKDLYIQRSKFRAQFAADVPAAQAAQMEATQRPIVEAALSEPAAGAPAWRSVPSWFIYGSLDRNIPPAVQPFMAQRAGAKRLVEVKGGSHVLMVSHPHEVAAMIEQAAAAK